MAQNNQQGQGRDQPTDSERFQYQTLISLFSLASQEFYSRFTAMVLTHTILLSGLIIGSDLLHDPNLDNSMKIIAMVIGLVGIILCVVWCLLLRQSLAAQHFYRNEAEEIENNLNFKIFSHKEWGKLNKGGQSIECLSCVAIALFAVLYVVLILFIAIV